MAAILNSAILDSAILHKKTSLIHSHSTWWWQPSLILPSWIQNHFAFKKNFTHSFWLNLMMAAILNSAILHSTILHKKNLLIHSDSTWWWQPSWILPSWILPSWIQPFCTKLWLKLIQSDSNSFILTQLDDGSHLEFGHLGFSHLSFSSQTHPHLPRLVHTISKKKNFSHSSLFTICAKYFTHSIWLTWWWQPSWILPSWIQPFCTKKKTSLIHSDSTWWWQPSWILPTWVPPSWIQPS